MTQSPPDELRSVSLNCSLKPSSEPSSTDLLLDQVEAALERQGVTVGDRIRVVDHVVAPGVVHDAGGGDEWPRILAAIMQARILVFGTPIWLGHPSSLAQRVLERLDAVLADTDERGQLTTVDRVAVVAVVGNEDGAHHVGAELFQGLDDVGFTVPANGMTYWVGEAMQGTDYRDLPETPEKVATTTRTLAANAAHLARVLARHPYPDLSADPEQG